MNSSAVVHVRASNEKSNQTQEGSGKESCKEARAEGEGYMAVYHDIEEIFYGPASGMPALSRVLYCIRHKLLRDGLGQKPIGHSFIMAKTGLTKSQVITAAKKLQRQGLILIKADSFETARGKIQYNENTYELNPAIFGEDYNWYRNNPTVRVYEKDKVGSYSRKGIAPSGIGSGPTPSIKSDTTPGIESDTGGVSNPIPGQDPKDSESLGNLSHNNPSSNNPYEQPSLKKEDGMVDKHNWESVRAYLLTQYPKDEFRIEGCYRQIHQRGYEREGQDPFHPSFLSAWFLKRYPTLRQEYAHHDPKRA